MSPSIWLLAVLFAATLSAAVESRATQRSFGPGRCGPIDPTYVRMTTETGGQLYILAPSETVQMSGVMAETSRSDSATILAAAGTAADAAGGFVVPVDTSVRRLTLSVMFDGTGGGAEIVRPDGAVVRAEADAGDAILNCGRILTVDAPAVPSSPFRIGVSRTTADGVRYQRMIGKPYRAESVEVVAPVLRRGPGWC